MFPDSGEQNVSDTLFRTRYLRSSCISVGKRVLGLPPGYEVQGSWRTDGVDIGRRGRVKVQ